jgi:L-ascorbate metabolism protein UlaG (beta-lactamase superfamily)
LDGWTIYHSGDNVRYQGMAEKLWSFRIDVTLLPINGQVPEGAFRAIYSDAKRPCWQKTWTRNWLYRAHFEMFEFNSASPDEFTDECRKLGQPFKVLRCDEQWRSES